MVDLSQLRIALFLKEFKQLIQEGGLYIVNRADHQKSLASLGLTKEGWQDRDTRTLSGRLLHGTSAR